jgi:hypothetical protein
MEYRKKIAEESGIGFSLPTRGNMKAFQVEFLYQDRKNGPEGSMVKEDASSLPGAIAKATRL